ncbi:hypothetical protein RvY_01268 [Ramazzottius varieornatus]|uniref:Uncharacterized protein n=1 Tax=Ramazzottius varieornatus TaxID=947166 RepID=A0A1D1UR06_RAMVA|nr:hypothetical protein RvY_01268 [Ramazzottius varieornatus]
MPPILRPKGYFQQVVDLVTTTTVAMTTSGSSTTLPTNSTPIPEVPATTPSQQDPGGLTPGQIALIVIGALLVFGLGGLVWLFGVRRGKSGRERRKSHCSDASDMDILRMEKLRNVAKNHK